MPCLPPSRRAHDLRPWTEWPAWLARRDPQSLAEWSRNNAQEIGLQRFLQFVFARQWQQLRAYAKVHGVRLIGDAPIFVAHDGSEVWSHPDWFYLDGCGVPTVVAGVPPDYFSATGQRWGNPLYRWDRLAADGYGFWIERLRHLLGLVDLVRIDHFRGFAGYWEIPGDEATAIHGRWVRGLALTSLLPCAGRLGGDLPLIAEDLGVITEDVEALRDGLELPGMAILQFAFEPTTHGFGQNQYLPHNHRRRLVVYTGTHDNETVAGWWAGLEEPIRDHVRQYLEYGWDRGPLGPDPRRTVFGGRRRLIPGSGRLGARGRGVHEPPGDRAGQLDLASEWGDSDPCPGSASAETKQPSTGGYPTPWTEADSDHETLPDRVRPPGGTWTGLAGLHRRMRLFTVSPLLLGGVVGIEPRVGFLVRERRAGVRHRLAKCPGVMGWPVRKP